MRFVVSLLFAILVSYPIYASAAFYKYYDESGGVNVTNEYKSIPERYRASVMTVTEKELSNKTKSRERQQIPQSSKTLPAQQQSDQNISAQNATQPAAAEKSDTATVSDNWLSRQLPLLKVSAVIALLIAGVVVAGKLISSVAPRPLATIIRVAMFAALSVYIFKGFSAKVVDAFSKISEESKSAQKAVDKRSEKIQKQTE